MNTHNCDDEAQLESGHEHNESLSLRAIPPTLQLQAHPLLSPNSQNEPFLGTQPSPATFRSSLYDKDLPDRPWSLRIGWQKCVALGSFCSALALIVNIGLLAWSLTKPVGDGNTRMLYSGGCDDMKTISTWSHFCINILSSLILASSNYAMQILVAPTRKDVDSAHSKGRSLDIGIPGFSNWSFLGKRRQFLYAALVITSIPLHLFYNSVIFSTTTAVNYQLYLGTHNYTEPPIQNNKTMTQTNARYPIWKDSKNWQNITAQQCYDIFSEDFVHDYSRVVVVVNYTSTENTFLNNYTRRTGLRSCADSTSSDCIGLYDPTKSEYWSHNTSDTWSAYPYQILLDKIIDKQSTTLVGIEYCLALGVRQSCTVELIPALLATVITCNILKIFILLALLWYSYRPLITIGDAIASFIDDPDPTTKGKGALSAVDLGTNNAWYTSIGSNRVGGQDGVFKPQRRDFLYGAPRSRWALGLGLMFLYWISGIILLSHSLQARIQTSFTQQWSSGFGAIIPGNVASNTSKTIIENVLVVNAPQLILSLVYLFYNALATCMLLSVEWTSYASTRKTLRTTQPEGNQRSTYFLSLPYRFGIPLLVASIFLHWALSQSLFLAQVNVLNADGSINLKSSIHTFGWSTLALTILISIGGILIVILLFSSFFKYKPGIPLALSNSRAISAACHPVPACGRGRDSVRALQYGVMIEGDGGGDGKRHVGFSTGTVDRLRYGEKYI